MPGGVLNAIGLSNPGVKEFKSEIIEGKQEHKPVIVSVFGATSHEVKDLVSDLEETEPAGYELNLSCPHGGKYGATVGQDPALVEEITRETRTVTERPLMVKLSGHYVKLLQVMAH